MAVVASLAVAAACVWVRGDEAMVGPGAVTAVAETDQVRGPVTTRMIPPYGFTRGIGP